MSPDILIPELKKKNKKKKKAVSVKVDLEKNTKKLRSK